MTEPILQYYQMGEGVTAFSTTRQGGFSQGAFGQFNINPYCGDSEEAVGRNRQLLCQLLGICDDRLLLPHQVHLTGMAVVDQALLSHPAEALEGMDALMTDVAGVCIGVSTADCIPVLLFDRAHRAVCAIHAGWRGTVQRIVGKAVGQMSAVYATRPADLFAQIGPGISLDSFEVGDEVYEAFASQAFSMDTISRRYGTGKWHIDLPLCNRQQLLSAGVPATHIAVSPVCTFRQCDTYFSARRLGIHSGRIFTGILME